METTYEKECNGGYFAKYNKKGNLLRTAERLNSGRWVIHTYMGLDLSGEYSEQEFNNIKKHFT